MQSTNFKEPTACWQQATIKIDLKDLDNHCSFPVNWRQFQTYFRFLRISSISSIHCDGTRNVSPVGLGQDGSNSKGPACDVSEVPAINDDLFLLFDCYYIYITKDITGSHFNDLESVPPWIGDK